MEDLFLLGLKEIFYTEHRTLRALHGMIEAATDGDLKGSLDAHVEDSKRQVKRLVFVFERLGQPPEEMRSRSIDCLIEEVDDAATKLADKSVLDALIVGAAQTIMHHKIARYGTLIAWAKELGHGNVNRCLTTNFHEAKSASARLTAIELHRWANLKAAS